MHIRKKKERLSIEALSYAMDGRFRSTWKEAARVKKGGIALCDVWQPAEKFHKSY